MNYIINPMNYNINISYLFKIIIVLLITNEQ